MRKSLFVLLTIFFHVFFLSSNLFAQGQCLGGGCSGGYQYPSGTLSSNTNSWTAVSTVNWAGEYGVYNVTSGSTYEWSLLAADGGSVSYDAELTLINNTSLATICYSNDFSGNVPKINWTANFTGTVRVLITQFSCATNTTNTTLVWRCSSCGSGSAPANDNCAGATNLTVFGSSCGGATTGDVSGATQSLPSLLCSGFTGDANDDVWYKFTATGTAHTITVVGSASFDAVVDVRSGACNGASIACADLTSSGGTEVINLTGLTISSVYYVRVYDYSSGMPATTTFNICVTTPSSCTPYYSTGTTYGDFINRVQLGTIDNTPAGTGSAGGPSYNDYYATVSTTLQAGTNQNLTVTVGTYGGQTVAAWIDYNADGDFADAGESLGEVANIAASTSGTINFTIPSGTAAGAKRMRVRGVWSSTALDPCTTYSYGEAEDYKINITAACTTPGTPATLSTSGITVSQAQLNWAAGSPAGSATVTYYWAIGAASNTTYEANYLFRGTTTSLNAIQASLNPGTTYYWTVKAVTSCDGTISSYAVSIPFTTLCTTPSTPTFPGTPTTNISTTSATLNWNASAGSPNITYNWFISASGAQGCSGGTNGTVSTTSVTVYGLTPNTTYYWTVNATTSCGGGSTSGCAVQKNFMTAALSGIITWSGATDGVWSTGTNWVGGVVPAVTNDVIIPVVATNYPNITTVGLSINNTTVTNQCKSLTINAGASVSVNAGGLYVYCSGDLKINGTFNHFYGAFGATRFIINTGGLVSVNTGGILNIGNATLAADRYNNININGGTLEITGGTVNVMGGLVHTSGTFRMVSGDCYLKTYGNHATDNLVKGWDCTASSIIDVTGGTVYVCGGSLANVMLGWNTTQTHNWTGGSLVLRLKVLSIAGTLDNNLDCDFAGKTVYNLTVNRSGKTTKLITNDVSINGDATLTAGTFNANGLNITTAGNWTNNSASAAFTAGTGAVTFTGAGKNINGSFGTNFNILTINAGATYTINPSGGTWPDMAAQAQGNFTGTGNLVLASGKMLDLYGTTNILNGNITAVSNYDGTRDIDFNTTGSFSGTGAINADMRVYSGTTTLTSNFTLNGDFIIRSGATFATNQTFTDNGSWTNDGTFTYGTSTVQFTGTGKNINGTSAGGVPFYNLTIKSGSNYTLNPSGAALVYGNFNSETGSSLTFASGKMLDLYSSSIVMNGTITATDLSNQSPDVDAGTDIYIENTNSLSGSGIVNADMNIWGGTTTLTSNFILGGDFKIQGGGTATFVMTTHMFTVGGSWVNRNVFNAGTGTVKFTGSNPEVIYANGNYNGLANANADFYNVTVDRGADSIALYYTPMHVTNNFYLDNGLFSTAWHTNATGNVGKARRFTVDKIANIDAGATFFVGYRKVCGNGDEALSSVPCGGGGCCNSDSLNVPVFKGDFINHGFVKTNRPVVSGYQDVKLAGARITGVGTTNEFGVDFQIESAMSATQVGPVDIQGDLIVQTGTSWINTDPNNVLSVRGNLYIYNSFTHYGIVNVYRDVNSGANNPTVFDVSGSTFNFYQSSATRFFYLSTVNIPINFNNVNIIAGAGNNRELRQNISVLGNLSIQSGSLDVNNSGTTSAGGSFPAGAGISNANITLSGSTSSWTNNATFNARAGSVSFTGNGAQTMGGSNATTFYNLTVNKGSSSEVSFANVGTVTNQLSLTTGYVVTDALKILIMADQSSVSPAGGQSGSFVRGPVNKIGRDGLGGPYSFLFPIGKNNIWGRLYMLHWSGITATTDAFTAEYFDAGYGNYAVNAPLNHVSTLEYWNLSKNSGDVGLNKKLRLYSEDKTRSAITAFNNVDLTVAHWNGTKWDDIDNPTSSNNSGNTSPAGWITSSNTSNFSPFTFGSRSGANPLPVELLSFTAKLNGSVVDLLWTTASEFNNDYFTVERSRDMTNFEPVAIVQGAGNSNIVLNYKTTDKEPLMGVSYYRLKQTDFDGKFSYSAMVPITISEFVQPNSNVSEHVLVYPNPSTGEVNINFTCREKGAYQLNVYDLMGNKMYSTEKVIETGETLLTLDLHELSAGIYFLNLETKGKRFSEKLILLK